MNAPKISDALKCCRNCGLYRNKRCQRKQHNYGAFRQTYWSCEYWEANKPLKAYERKLQKAQEMVELWIKDDAPGWVKETVRNEFLRHC